MKRLCMVILLVLLVLCGAAQAEEDPLEAALRQSPWADAALVMEAQD